jgi:pimeloyl-ACP methyl ester carboxylesterase
MLAILGIGLASALAAAPTDVESVRLPLVSGSSQYVALHCASPKVKTDRAVLFIHGASFPTMLAFGYEFTPGDSWMSYMAKQGYLACGLDFLGFGASSRPPTMASPPQGVAPIDRAPEAAQQIAAAVDYLIHRRGIVRLHLIAHSWGTVPAALYVASHPEIPVSLTLFGPIVPVADTKPGQTEAAWWQLSAQDRYEQLKFTDVLPKGMDLLEPSVHARWASEFDASAAPDSKTSDGDLRIPAGPLADIREVHAGTYPYAQAKITCPVFVVYGDYDTEVNDDGASAFLARFSTSPMKWRLRIDHGTHVMHLEKNRHSLYASVYAFIQAVDTASP